MVIGRLGVAVAFLAALLAVAWGCAALWVDGPASRAIAALLLGAYAGAALLALLVLRPWWRKLGGLVVLFAAVLAWWLTIAPRNDRDWQPDVARLPFAHLRGQLLTIENVRDFDYRSVDDYDERWETRTWDLSKLVGLDLSLVHWGSPLIAHTIMSWVFEEGPPLAISIETRKEKGETYSAFRGFFRQYELYYVVADERDVLRLRTNYRGEDVYLYQMRASPAQARALLMEYVAAIDRLARKPAWYNAISHNCTTAIEYHIDAVTSGRPWDWRILVNGLVDELGYERGAINTELPFADVKSRSYINPRARAADHDPEFSRRIREGLPPRPPGPAPRPTPGA